MLEKDADLNMSILMVRAENLLVKKKTGKLKAVNGIVGRPAPGSAYFQVSSTHKNDLTI